MQLKRILSIFGVSLIIVIYGGKITSAAIPCGLDVSSEMASAYGEITEILIKVGTALGALMLAIEGIRWISSDSPRGRDDARKGVVYVVIGLILLISATKLVEYLLC